MPETPESGVGELENIRHLIERVEELLRSENKALPESKAKIEQWEAELARLRDEEARLQS